MTTFTSQKQLLDLSNLINLHYKAELVNNNKGLVEDNHNNSKI